MLMFFNGATKAAERARIVNIAAQGEGQSEVYREFWRDLNRGEFIARKFLRIGKGGREVWIQASYNPVLDAAGKPFKVIKFATDVTAVEHERMASEEERRRIAEEQDGGGSVLAASLKRKIGRAS